MQVQNNSEKTKFLNKEEELELGVLIQEHFKAKDELNTDKPFTNEEYKVLEEKIEIGKEAIEKLVKANLGLVYDRARVFKTRFPGGPEYEDLVQEGMAGLMTAVKKYDPERGNKFSTVAFYWIAQAVSRGANKTGRIVRLPENRINDFGKISTITNSPEAKDFSPAKLDEHIMEQLGLSQVDLMNIRAAAATPASLNKVVSSESGSNKELIDFIADDKASDSSEDMVMKKQMHEVLNEAIDSLTQIKKDVILASFALGEDKELTSDKVKEQYNLQTFKFKRIQTEAVRELKNILTTKGLSFADFARLN